MTRTSPHPSLQTIAVGGTDIAYRHLDGTPQAGPAIVFLPGYMSDMEGSKATAIAAWCQREGRECLLLDYSGCGSSAGAFADGTLTRWRDEVLALIAAQVRAARIVLIGSSMGGWLMVLVGLALGERLHAMVGIAAAPDFTEWGFDNGQKAALQGGQTVFEESDYGYDPMPTHPGFWADGEANRVLNAPIPLTCPVRLLHGQDDTDVPPSISLRLAAALQSADVQVTLVKQGDHRLSRSSDVALLLHTVAAVCDADDPPGR